MVREFGGGLRMLSRRFQECFRGIGILRNSRVFLEGFKGLLEGFSNKFLNILRCFTGI